MTYRYQRNKDTQKKFKSKEETIVVWMLTMHTSFHWRALCNFADGN